MRARRGACCLRLLGTACVLALLAACGALRGLDIEAEVGRVEADQPLLVVIPGLLASRLREIETGRRVWPPNMLMLLTGWQMRDLALPLPYERAAGYRTLSPTDVVLSRPRRDYYSGLLDALAGAGYDCVPPPAVGPDVNCVLFAWDWRDGFVAAAAELEELLERSRAGRDETAERVDIVAHSAGAMVARYYARFGGRDVLEDEAARADAGPVVPVRRMVLIGPPNRGSMFSALSLMHGYPLGFFTVEPEVLTTFDTSYALLPHPEREWVLDAEGATLELDLYDPALWRRFELSIYDPAARERVASRFESTGRAARHLEALERRFARGLEHGRRFHEALSSGASRATGTEYLLVGSDCEPTTRYFVRETAADGETLRLAPDDVRGVPGIDYGALMLEPGDGRVTRSSLLALEGPGAAAATAAAVSAPRARFVCDRHSEITSNDRVRVETLRFVLD